MSLYTVHVTHCHFTKLPKIHKQKTKHLYEWVPGILYWMGTRYHCMNGYQVYCMNGYQVYCMNGYSGILYEWVPGITVCNGYQVYCMNGYQVYCMGLGTQVYCMHNGCNCWDSTQYYVQCTLVYTSCIWLSLTLIVISPSSLKEGHVHVPTNTFNSTSVSFSSCHQHHDIAQYDSWPINTPVDSWVTVMGEVCQNIQT